MDFFFMSTVPIGFYSIQHSTWNMEIIALLQTIKQRSIKQSAAQEKCSRKHYNTVKYTKQMN